MDFEQEKDRRTEWFVPTFGPLKFRILIGLLFLPYTGMVLAFAVIGSMMAERIHWDRVGAVLLIYFLALGIGAHALDAVGSKGAKPWAAVFSEKQLWGLAILALFLAYAVGIYYMVLYTPLLWIIAVLEGFFLLAYNLEWFAGRFHTDAWFAFSWGSLPVLAGYILQTNRVSLPVLLVAASTGFLSLVEIKASRPYKTMKRANYGAEPEQVEMLESILKSISLGTILLGAGLLSWRWMG
jgi:hypothetical protein